ncbi:hypothetical protein CJP74_04165 [Psittacicella melopsittaci]|uniref:2-C-methyl-D-erythritol 4-phosphate cytidylyltransferase n=1 Tax=Psittacicella melopsittaci TaxID=2028576 RepID=A0A3A1Y5D7_9GAMM|nr:2-C-methyl-D-erythritol 4-phosphate cytidylyltransferase [Psittacicella melopsittaci]RIY32580.1 hypothetical protein CJP74_04165 [Psittacicella melopsittaci]
MAKHIALLCAAGVGSRMQAQVPKQYLSLDYQGKKQSILEIAIKKFSQHQCIDATLVALNENDTYCNALPEFANFSSQTNDHLQALQANNLYACLGYGQRIHTVYSLLANAMELCLQKSWQPEQTYVLIHDAARPCIRSEDIDLIVKHIEQLDSLEQILAKSEQGEPVQGGILPAASVVDSVKQISGSYAQDNLDRDKLVLAQTPQTFNLLYLYYLVTKLFLYAEQDIKQDKYHAEYTKYLQVFPSLEKLENSKLAELKLRYNKALNKQSKQQIFASLTDDCSVVVYFNDLVKVVLLGRHNLKVTVPEDLDLAQFYLNLGK